MEVRNVFDGFIVFALPQRRLTYIDTPITAVVSPVYDTTSGSTAFAFAWRKREHWNSNFTIRLYSKVWVPVLPHPSQWHSYGNLFTTAEHSLFPRYSGYRNTMVIRVSKHHGTQGINFLILSSNAVCFPRTTRVGCCCLGWGVGMRPGCYRLVTLSASCTRPTPVSAESRRGP